MKAVAIYCVDGRLENTRARVRQFVNTLGYEISDGNLYGITKPGPDATCSGMRGALHEDSVLEDINLLLERGVEIGAVILVAHAECAGHQVPNDDHKSHVEEGARKLHGRYNVPVVALFDEKTESGQWELCLCSHFVPNN